MNIKVSIILSLYNSEKTVDKTIQSILMQSYKNYEVIIINDGSTDKTYEILKKYNKKKKIKIFNFNRNLGLATRLNYAIKKSIGDYIVRIDSDDLMTKKRIIHQLNQFKKDGSLDVVGGSALYINALKKKKIYTIKKDSEIKNKMIYYNPIIHSSVMFKKKSIIKLGGYDKNFLRCQDYELWLRGKLVLKFLNTKKILVVRNVSNFQFQASNVFYLLRARLKNSNNFMLFVFSHMLFLKDLFIYIIIKLRIKKLL